MNFQALQQVLNEVKEIQPMGKTAEIDGVII